MNKIDDLARQFGNPIVVPCERNMYNNPGQSFSILDDPGCIIMHGIACSGQQIASIRFSTISLVIIVLFAHVISSCFLSGEIAHNTLDYKNIGQK